MVLCEGLAVGRSGLYDDQRRQRAPARSGAESEVLERIKAIAEKTRHRYGSRRLATQLQEEGDAMTEEGWLYTSGLLDLYSRKVVGWAMREHVETQWVRDAWEMALGRRQPDAGLIHHSDRGSQYASHAYRSMLAEQGMACSMSGTGAC